MTFGSRLLRDRFDVVTGLLMGLGGGGVGEGLGKRGLEEVGGGLRVFERG